MRDSLDSSSISQMNEKEMTHADISAEYSITIRPTIRTVKTVLKEKKTETLAHQGSPEARNEESPLPR